MDPLKEKPNISTFTLGRPPICYTEKQKVRELEASGRGGWLVVQEIPKLEALRIEYLTLGT